MNSIRIDKLKLFYFTVSSSFILLLFDARLVLFIFWNWLNERKWESIYMEQSKIKRTVYSIVISAMRTFKHLFLSM